MLNFAGVFGTNCVLEVGTSMILQRCHAKTWTYPSDIHDHFDAPVCSVETLLLSLEGVWHCSFWESLKNQRKKSGW